MDFEEQRRIDELAAYEAHLIRYYAQKDYQAILTEINVVLDTVPNHTQECRYRFLRAQCIGWLDGRARGRDNYIAALEQVTASCDSSEQALAALEILAGLGVGQEEEKGKGDKADAVPPMPDNGNFTDKPVLEHYFAVVIPVAKGGADETKADLADFNRQFFASANLKVTSNLLDRENQLVLVKQFPARTGHWTTSRCSSQPGIDDRFEYERLQDVRHPHGELRRALQGQGCRRLPPIL